MTGEIGAGAAVVFGAGTNGMIAAARLAGGQCRSGRSPGERPLSEEGGQRETSASRFEIVEQRLAEARVETEEASQWGTIDPSILDAVADGEHGF